MYAAKELCRCGPVVSHSIPEVVCELFPKD